MGWPCQYTWSTLWLLYPYPFWALIHSDYYLFPAGLSSDKYMQMDQSERRKKKSKAKKKKRSKKHGAEESEDEDDIVPQHQVSTVAEMPEVCMAIIVLVQVVSFFLIATV